MALLKEYEVRDNGNDSFNLKITIPDNCDYLYTYDGTTDTHRVEIKLDMDKKPSSRYIIRDENIPTSGSSRLNIDMEQTENGLTATKPKIVIEIWYWKKLLFYSCFL